MIGEHGVIYVLRQGLRASEASARESAHARRGGGGLGELFFDGEHERGGENGLRELGLDAAEKRGETLVASHDAKGVRGAAITHALVRHVFGDHLEARFDDLERVGEHGGAEFGVRAEAENLEGGEVGFGLGFEASASGGFVKGVLKRGIGHHDQRRRQSLPKSRDAAVARDFGGDIEEGRFSSTL